MLAFSTVKLPCDSLCPFWKNDLYSHILIRMCIHAFQVNILWIFHEYIKCYSSGLIFHLFFTVMGGAINMSDTICKDDKTPIVIVIPGLTSDSASAVSFLFVCLFPNHFMIPLYSSSKFTVKIFRSIKVRLQSCEDFN